MLLLNYVIKEAVLLKNDLTTGKQNGSGAECQFKSLANLDVTSLPLNKLSSKRTSFFLPFSVDNNDDG